MTFVFFCGRPLLTIVYGQRYASAAISLSIASLVALLNLLNGQLTSVFFGRGMPDLHRRCVVIMAITMIILIYPCVKHFGIAGGQLSALAAITMGLLFQVVRVRHLTRLHLADYSRIYLVSAVISLVVVVVCLGNRALLLAANPIPQIVVGIAGCMIAYGLSATFFLRRYPGQPSIPRRTLETEVASE